MKKLFLSASLVLVSPSLVLGSAITPGEAQYNLNQALESGNTEEIDYWLAIIDSLKTSPKPASTSVINHEEAERLTRQLLQEEERYQKEQQLQQDEAFARTLASLDLEEHQPSHNRIPVSPEDAGFLRNLAERSWRFENKDVHAFNAEIVRPHLAKTLEIGQRYLPSREDIPAETVLTQMREVIGREGDFSGKDKESIRLLEEHLKKNAVDSETGIHVPSLLSRLWNLARNNTSSRFSVGAGQAERNAVQMIVHISMPEGLETQGGCFPGYAGRLFRDYLTLLTSVLNIH